MIDEKRWNEVGVADVAKNGRNAAQLSKYQASKTLAEKGSTFIVLESYATLSK